jgi:hypothetical protein
MKIQIFLTPLFLLFAAAAPTNLKKGTDIFTSVPQRWKLIDLDLVDAVSESTIEGLSADESVVWAYRKE